MAHILRLLYGWHRIEHLLVYEASLFGIGIYREIAHAERGEVLEEVGALTRIDVVILQCHLYDDAGGTDMRPLDRYAQVMITRSPAARTYQHIILAICQELAVDALDIIGYIEIVHRRELVIVLHIHHIGDILADAMAQGVVGTEQTVGIRYRPDILVEHLLGIHDRTDLEEIEIAGLVGMDIASKLNLHRSAHRLGTALHRHLHEFRQGYHIVLEHSGKGDELAAGFIHTVVDDLIVRVEGRGDVVETQVFYRILHAELEDIESVIHLEVIAHVLHVEGVELGLGIAQRHLCLGSLQHLMRMIRTDAEGLTAIHDILTQSEGKTGYTLLCLLIADRIIVERTEHATHRRIIAGAVVLAHHLLQDNRHLLLVDDVAGGCHVCLGIAIEYRGIHALDGTGEHLEHLILIVEIRNHIGGIDAGERLIVGIFEQRTGTDGDRTLRCLEEGEEVGYQRIGQLRMEEVLQDFIIAGIAQGYRIEIVAHHELVEDIGTEHHGLRNLHGGILILVELGMALDDVVEEGKSPALSAQ